MLVSPCSLSSNACCSTSPHCIYHIVLQAEVTELEAVVEEVHNQFQSLDQQMSHASQTATKIGDRLQVSLLECEDADSQREACPSPDKLHLLTKWH